MLLRNKLLSSSLRNIKVTQFIKPTTLKFSTNHEIAEGVALQHKFDTLKVSDIDREEFQKDLNDTVDDLCHFSSQYLIRIQ